MNADDSLESKLDARIIHGHAGYEVRNRFSICIYTRRDNIGTFITALGRSTAPCIFTALANFQVPPSDATEWSYLSRLFSPQLADRRFPFLSYGTRRRLCTFKLCINLRMFKLHAFRNYIYRLYGIFLFFYFPPLFFYFFETISSIVKRFASQHFDITIVLFAFLDHRYET